MGIGLFHRISVRAKMLMVVTLPLVALLVLGVVAVRGMDKIEAGAVSLYDNRIQPLERLKGLSDEYGANVVIPAGRVQAGIMTPAVAAGQVESARQRIMQSWTGYENMGHTEAEMDAVRSVGAAVREADQVIGELVERLREMGSQGYGSLDSLLPSLYDKIEPISHKVTGLVGQELVLAAEDRARIEAVYQSTEGRFIVGGLVALAVLAYIGLMVYLAIAKPIRSLRDTFQEVDANADLTIRAEVKSSDGIGVAGNAFNHMMDSFRELVTSISDATTRLASAADDMSQVSVQASEATQQQQSETEHVATAMSQMTSTVQDVARSAAEAASAAQHANQQTQTGDRVVKSVISSIQNLAGEVQSTADVVSNLESATVQIGSVLDVIRNIAEQTNLLALNAAIEAARAGEQGRGFAVVADEVRTLASRTQESTQEIQQMIENLQSGAKNAVAAMEQGQEKADQSVSEAREAGTALAEVLSAVATISDMNTQIASAAEEQGAVAEEISRNITNINELSHQTATGAERSTGASDAVSYLAGQLQELGGRFRI